MDKVCLLFSALLCTVGLHADDQLRDVQQALKDQGFYYGEVDGEGGTETNAAIRRYQIRNGLEVTGKLNEETAAALRGKSSSQPPPPAYVGRDQNPPPARVTPGVAENDRSFLRRQPPADEPSSEPPMQEPEETDVTPRVPQENYGYSPSLALMFRRTPYDGAPEVVQRDTLRRAQARLAREGFYRGDVDGVPGPMTQQAIAEFQHDVALRPTGRLDGATLAELNLLPSRRTFGPAAPRYYVAPPTSRRVYRGIWVR